MTKLSQAPFSLGNVSIRQSDELYSLNDLHRAAGGEDRHRPNQFFRAEQTQSLINEISNAQIRAFESKRGAKGGTYACRELVIAYAAWISPAFHLKVIRVFLAASTPHRAQAATPALEQPRGMTYIFVTPQERTIIENLRCTTYAGRDIVQLTAQAMQLERPWIWGGSIVSNTQRLPSALISAYRRALIGR